MESPISSLNRCTRFFTLITVVRSLKLWLQINLYRKKNEVTVGVKSALVKGFLFTLCLNSVIILFICRSKIYFRLANLGISFCKIWNWVFYHLHFSEFFRSTKKYGSKKARILANFKQCLENIFYENCRNI